MNKTHTLELRGERELIFSRHFAAPRQLVWDCYTNCAHLAYWWAPIGWELTHCKLDLRVGGTWHYCMAGEYEGNRMESWGLATYKTIDAPQQLVYEDAFSDKDGNVNADMPQMLITVTFEEVDGGTRMTSNTLLASAEARQQIIDMGVEDGVAGTYERLDAYLLTR